MAVTVSGDWAGLSGIIDDIYSRYDNLFRLLLTRVTTTSFTSYSNGLDAWKTSVAGTLADLKQTIYSLDAGMSNLIITSDGHTDSLSVISGILTGYTGTNYTSMVLLSGWITGHTGVAAVTGHYRGLTGELP